MRDCVKAGELKRLSDPDNGAIVGVFTKGAVDPDELLAAIDEDPDLDGLYATAAEVRQEYRRWECCGLDSSEDGLLYLNQARKGERGAFLVTIIESR